MPAAAPLVLRWRGSELYEASFDAMRAFTDARTVDTPDEIWLVEHPPVFTLGQAGDPAHLLAADSGLGQMIEMSRQMLRIDVVMVGVLITGVIGFALDYSFRQLEQRLFRWQANRGRP